MVLRRGMDETVWNFSAEGTLRAGFGTGRFGSFASGLAHFGEVRYSRIAALKRQIQAGTYRVSTAQLAEALLGRMFARRDRRWTNTGLEGDRN